MADATAAAPVKKSGAGKIIVLVIVLLIGYGIYKSAGNATPTTPDGVVERMGSRMSEVESVEYAGTVTANIEGGKNPLASLTGGSAANANKPVAFSVAFAGTSEFGDWEKPESAIKLTLTSPEFPNNGSAEIEFKNVGADKFFKFNTIPVLGKLNLSSLTNMWVKLDAKKSTSTVVVATSTMSEDTAEEVKDIISGGKYFQVSEDLGEESLGGISTHHYKVTLNEAEVMRVARAVSTEVNGKAPSINDEKKMNEFFARAEMSDAEVWVGTKDYYLYKTKFGVTVAKSDAEPSSGTIAVELELRNFNEKVTVEAPTGAKTMNEFMGAFVGAMLGGGGMPAGFMK
ncbi:MAG TPA: hypothetical protein PK295_02425 [Candidatus Magasanikbacteria bacterium]|nr:hypothetical protein [Candidatus Magasanikbacteria bacterium]